MFWMNCAAIYSSFLFVRDVLIPLLTTYLLAPIILSVRTLMGRNNITQRRDRRRRRRRQRVENEEENEEESTELQRI